MSDKNMRAAIVLIGVAVLSTAAIVGAGGVIAFLGAVGLAFSMMIAGMLVQKSIERDKREQILRDDKLWRGK